MGLLSFSKALTEKRQVLLSNTFIFEYMTVAPEQYTKVYLMGLAFCGADDNELEGISIALSLDSAAVVEAFSYWHEQGLVNMTHDPLAIEYLPVIPQSKRIRKFSKEKYKTFNDQLNVMIKNRNILPSEFNEYYSCMETYGIEVEAMLTIIGYCTRLKGDKVTYPYILAVARNLAHAGCKTYERVSEHLACLDLYDEDLKAVLKTLKLRRSPDHNDKNMLHRWKNELGFSQEVIIQVAKRVTKGGIVTLDMLLSRYYENKLFTVQEIDEFNKNRDELYSLTRNILKILGLRYDSLDYIIETYITPFLRQGFTKEALDTIADYCFRRNIRTLEGMANAVSRFYKQGLVSVESIASFLGESIAQDETIKNLLAKLNIFRAVNTFDRDYYKTWKKSWMISDELLEYACTISRDKTSPVSYMNAILASWYDKKITTLSAAQATSESAMTSGKTTALGSEKTNLVNRNLSAEELNAMFDRLENDEL